MEPYIGEIKLWALTYAPDGWALCNGQIMQVAMNKALFALLGNAYGGDGVTTFALPDLRGRVPVSAAAVKTGIKGGSETVTLTSQQVPPHSHQVAVNPNAGNKAAGLNNHIAAAVTKDTPPKNVSLYADGASPILALDPATVSSAGGGGGHDNMQPYLALNYFIATKGIWPPRP